MSDRPWWAHVVQWSLWLVVMLLVMGWLGRTRMKAKPGEAAGTLAHPASTLIVGVACTAFGALLTGYCAVTDNPTATDWVVLGFGIFTLASSTIILDYFMARHRVTNDGIEYRTMFGRRGHMPWREVSSLAWAPAMKWFRLTGKDGRVVRISVMLRGLPAFARLALWHVPRGAIKADVRTVLEETADGRPPTVWG